MNSIIECIKKEFRGWKLPEIAGLLVVFAIILFNFFVLKDSKIATISAFCGIMYTVIAGKGKISCYLFGLSGSGFYSYLAYANALYGNLALYLFYYIPMQIIGVFKWKSNLKKDTQEIYKTSLSIKERVLLVLVSVILSFVICSVLYVLNDTHPIYDGIGTALSLVGMYLTVRRCIEQWIVWFVVNLFSMLMWVCVILAGGKTYSTVLMWFVYLLLSVYFYKEWEKEVTPHK